MQHLSIRRGVMSWQDMVLFSVIFHAVRHLFEGVQDYRNHTSLARVLRKLSADGRSPPSIRRMK